MKLISSVCLGVMALCFVMQYALSYYMGYYETSFYPLTCRDVLASALIFIVLLIVIIVWIISLAQKKHRLTTTGLMIGAFVLILLKCVMPSSNDMIVYGLRDRLIHDYNPDTLRQFANEIRRLNPAISAPSYERQDLVVLRKKYSFLDWAEGTAFVNDINGVVTVKWGGFIGRWGFKVANDKGKLELSSEPNAKALRLSDDIFVFWEPD